MYVDQHITLSKMDYLDVKNLAQTGEGAFLEFKRTVPSAWKIARELAAFANTNGGTLLVGVDDDKSLVGVESYQEDHFLLKKAARQVCHPKIDLKLEIVPFGDRDLLVIRVDEASEKPVYVRHKKKDLVYIREADQSKAVSRERVQIMEKRQSPRGVTFEYGADEQKLFRYLNEYPEISVEQYAKLIHSNERQAGQILVNLATVGVLKLFNKKNIDYFTFSH